MKEGAEAGSARVNGAGESAQGPGGVRVWRQGRRFGAQRKPAPSPPLLGPAHRALRPAGPGLPARRSPSMVGAEVRAEGRACREM